MMTVQSNVSAVPGLDNQANLRTSKQQTNPHCPGELLWQDVMCVGSITDIGNIYLYTVMDAYNRYVFGLLENENHSEASVNLLNDQVLPFYRSANTHIQVIKTDNSSHFTREKAVSFKAYLQRNNIDHLLTGPPQLPVKKPLEVFYDHVREQLFQRAISTSMNDLRQNFAEWLVRYNVEHTKQ
jgi:transposase InsO family protein